MAQSSLLCAKSLLSCSRPSADLRVGKGAKDSERSATCDRVGRRLASFAPLAPLAFPSSQPAEPADPTVLAVGRVLMHPLP